MKGFCIVNEVNKVDKEKEPFTVAGEFVLLRTGWLFRNTPPCVVYKEAPLAKKWILQRPPSPTRRMQDDGL